MTAIDVVFWDFGGVFTPSPFGPGNSEYAQSLGVSLDTLTDLVLGYHTPDGDHPWHRLERGELTMKETSELVRQNADAAGLTSFSMADFFGAMGGRKPGESTKPPGEGLGTAKARPEMVALVEEARAAGARNCIITNNVKEFSERWRNMLDLALFDHVIDSCVVGVRKPDPAIYHLALEAMGNPDPTRTAFLDDFEPNLDASAELGIKPVLVETDVTSAIEALRLLLAG